MPIEFTCETCGIPFFKHLNHGQPYRFCSRACRFAPRPGIPQDDGSILVPVSQECFAIIDAEDAECVLALNWWRHPVGYAAHTSNKITILMHRLVLGLPVARTPVVDHISGNPLDNRKANLRTATVSQNAMNSKMRVDNTSGYRGVVRDIDSGRWIARFSAEGRTYNLGRFATAEEAARVRDDAARRLGGGYAVLNFPD
jgi:hypothetical protein